MKEVFRAGFCGFFGRPNVGKSTLVNALVGRPLAIVSAHPHTTRETLRGVLTLARRQAQIIVVDTPGMDLPSRRPGGSRGQMGKGGLGKFMAEQVAAAASDVDVLVAIADARERAQDDLLVERIRSAKQPAILVLNKIDQVRDKRQLLPRLEMWAKAAPNATLVPLSAHNGDGVPRLLDVLIALLPESPPLFPEDMWTDAPERFLAAERVREQVLLLTRQEVPHSVAVTIDTFVDREKSIAIEATIHVEKVGQKAILVGRAGQAIKQIGMRARQALGDLLGVPVHLSLFVRVDPEWRRSRHKLREFGYGGDPGGPSAPKEGVEFFATPAENGETAGGRRPRPSRRHAPKKASSTSASTSDKVDRATRRSESRKARPRP